MCAYRSTGFGLQPFASSSHRTVLSWPSAADTCLQRPCHTPPVSAQVGGKQCASNWYSVPCISGRRYGEQALQRCLLRVVAGEVVGQLCHQRSRSQHSESTHRAGNDAPIIAPEYCTVRRAPECAVRPHWRSSAAARRRLAVPAGRTASGALRCWAPLPRSCESVWHLAYMLRPPGDHPRLAGGTSPLHTPFEKRCAIRKPITVRILQNLRHGDGEHTVLDDELIVETGAVSAA